MSRLIVLAQRPYHLSVAEAEEWLRAQVVELAGLGGVLRVDMTRLASASLRFGREWDWLLEVHLDAAVDAQHTLREPACTGLLADLRLLGMRPAVAIAGPTASAGDAC